MGRETAGDFTTWEYVMEGVREGLTFDDWMVSASVVDDNLFCKERMRVFEKQLNRAF